MKRIAIIPARSGSKGLKNKNTIELCGKPLMAYSIEAAVETKLFSRIILTTDSQLYAHIGKKYGAEALMRGEEISNDKASSYMVIKDVLERVGEEYNYFVLLQPTSPLRTASQIKEAISLFDARFEDIDFLVSVKKSEVPACEIHSIEEDGTMKNFGNNSNYRRQNYEEYTPNGAIYVAKPKAYLETKDFYGPKSLAYKMSYETSIDIDTQLDLELAKIIIANNLK